MKSRNQKIDWEFEKLIKEIMKIKIANGEDPTKVSIPKITHELATNTKCIEILKKELGEFKELNSMLKKDRSVIW